MSLSLYDLFVSMGPFAKFIVVVLFLMSLISWTSSFQKLWQLWRSPKEAEKFAPPVSRFLPGGQVDRAPKLARETKSRHGGAGRGGGLPRGEAVVARRRPHTPAAP